MRQAQILGMALILQNEIKKNLNNSKIAVWRVCVAAFRSLFENAAEMDAKTKDG